MGHYKNVIFVLENPLTRWDIERFGFDFFHKHDIQVIVLDIGVITSPEVRKHYVEDVLESFKAKVIVINSFQELDESLMLYSKDSFLFYFSGRDQFSSLKIMWSISRSKIVWGSGVLSTAGAHFGFSEKKKFDRIKVWINLISIKFLINWILRKLFYKFLLRRYDFFMFGCRESESRAFNISKCTKIIKTHSFDFNTLLKSRAQGKILKKNKIVYLDSYYPYHPEFVTLGLEWSKKDIERFFLQLNKFFEILERQFNVEVIIAAHPRSNGWKHHGDVWNGREIFQNNTIHAVESSIACVALTSTAINFAVMCNRPLFLFKMKTIEGYYGPMLSALKERLGAYCVDLDNEYLSDIDFTNLLTYDDQKYKKYMENYIGYNSSPRIDMWEFLLNSISNKKLENSY